MQSDDTSIIQAVVAALQGAQGICVMTGAGVSAESGVPTFRGAGGLWEGHDPIRLATPEAFAADPDLVWRFYAWRRSVLAGCDPNPAHHAVAALESRAGRFSLVTQNVDGLHARAGSRRVVELHGNIWIDRCTRCEHQNVVSPSQFDGNAPPPCAHCGARMRPGVVWFGEALPGSALAEVERALEVCDVMLVVGTSAVVQPAASFAHVAAARGAFVAEINPEDTPLSTRASVSIRGKAGEVLPRIVDSLDGGSSTGWAAAEEG